MDGPGIWEEQSESGGDGKRAILTGSPGKADEGSEGLCAGLILGAVRHLPRNHVRPQHAFGSISNRSAPLPLQQREVGLVGAAAPHGVAEKLQPQIS